MSTPDGHIYRASYMAQLLPRSGSSTPHEAEFLFFSFPLPSRDQHLVPGEVPTPFAISGLIFKAQNQSRFAPPLGFPIFPRGLCSWQRPSPGAAGPRTRLTFLGSGGSRGAGESSVSPLDSGGVSWRGGSRRVGHIQHLPFIPTTADKAGGGKGGRRRRKPICLRSWLPRAAVEQALVAGPETSVSSRVRQPAVSVSSRDRSGGAPDLNKGRARGITSGPASLGARTIGQCVHIPLPHTPRHLCPATRGRSGASPGSDGPRGPGEKGPSQKAPIRCLRVSSGAKRGYTAQVLGDLAAWS